jgi:hypothetical protein
LLDINPIPRSVEEKLLLCRSWILYYLTNTKKANNWDVNLAALLMKDYESVQAASSLHTSSGL